MAASTRSMGHVYCDGRNEAMDESQRSKISSVYGNLKLRGKEEKERSKVW
jgi:hypothetical protein